MRLNRHNGDGRLRPDQRIAYLALNAIDNARPNAGRDSGLEAAWFACDRAARQLEEMAGTPSPSRALCDLLWANLPWAALAEAVGPLRVLDLGCGSGEYALKFQAWSDHRIERYIGVDLQTRPKWELLAAEHRFIEFRAANIERVEVPAGTNLILSQSTLEHVHDERACFERIHDYAHSTKSPLLQIHAVPSAACLRLYLWHGYRQYTPRTISTITRPFADCSQRMLVALGGAACNRLHWEFITRPFLARQTSDRRDLEPAAYRQALAAAIARDMTAASTQPAFYVIVIYSNGRGPMPVSDCWRG